MTNFHYSHRIYIYFSQHENHALYPFNELHSDFSEDKRDESQLTHCTLLYNDEVHSYDDVINQLKLAVPRCSEELATQFATRIDGSYFFIYSLSSFFFANLYKHLNVAFFVVVSILFSYIHFHRQ